MDGSFSSSLSETVRRACTRSATTIHLEMTEGIDSLATVASVAPFVGFLGTAIGMIYSFPGFEGSKSEYLAVVAGGLSGAMWFSAFGIFVGLLTLWCHRYLSGKMEDFRVEMEGATFHLVNQLGTFKGQWQVGSANNIAGSRLLFGAPSPSTIFADARFRRSALFFTTASLLASWLIRLGTLFFVDSVPINAAPWAACRYVLLIFAVSCFPAHVLWVKFLRRRGGGLVAGASALSLCWCVAQLLVKLG